MRHNQYREGILERLRCWRVANPDATIAQARKEMRGSLSTTDIDLLFDNWLNANFDRIEVRSVGKNSHTAVIRSHGAIRRETPSQRAAKQRVKDSVISKMADIAFESFASHIWETLLPNGVMLRDATGKDLKHAAGWHAELAKHVKPTEKLAKKLSTRDLFNISQRLN